MKESKKEPKRFYYTATCMLFFAIIAVGNLIFMDFREKGEINYVYGGFVFVMVILMSAFIGAIQKVEKSKLEEAETEDGKNK